MEIYAMGTEKTEDGVSILITMPKQVE